MSVPSSASVSTVRQIPEQDESGQEPAASPPLSGTSPRRASIQRLAASVPPVTKPSETSSTASDQSSLAGPRSGSPGIRAGTGPARSAIAAALASYGRSPPSHGTPPVRAASPAVASPTVSTPAVSASAVSAPAISAPAVSERVPLLSSSPGKPPMYGTPLASTPRTSSPRPAEDPQVIRRMLVQPEDISRVRRESSAAGQPVHSRGSRAPSIARSAVASEVGAPGPALDRDGFSSLQLQGGDITRQIYRWADQNDGRSIRTQRSRSFALPRPEIDEITNVKAPGGLRRHYLDTHGHGASSGHGIHENGSTSRHGINRMNQTPSFLASMTSYYASFAGEDLREEDEYDDDDHSHEEVIVEEDTAGEGDGDGGERRPMLRRTKTAADRRRQRTLTGPHGQSSVSNTTAQLLKSFVGTGVLFLPRAFLNGGMVFSSVVLVLVAAVSYYCFMLLVAARKQSGGSFGDLGEAIYGKAMRNVILGSLVISQFGFVAAYIVFVAENLRAFIEAVSNCAAIIPLKWTICMQLLIIVPLSLIRRVDKLSGVSAVANSFIVVGLLYLYGQDIASLVRMGGMADIVPFNPINWSSFIGTAVFTFEGVGLILPLQEGMREPRKFPSVLAGVMVFITILFTSIGALSYAAFGSATKTVILLNMPQDNVLLNVVQLLYSLAILLSVPLQLFPAIRILEQGVFARSGRHDRWVKWSKNLCRLVFCLFCATVAWLGSDNLDKFVSLVGSFACIPLVYVYPPLLHYRAVAKSLWQRVVDVMLVVCGAVLMVYTTGLTISNWSWGAAPSSGFCDEI